MKNKQLTIEEKIEKIENSENFEDLKTGWFPQSASTSYYFVSYCHKDYKKVFIDILGMQQYDSEIAVWYDRELNVGRDWEKEAKTHIYDFDCLGVIFYISENSVESPAVFKEMQMAIDADKPFIPIVLPVETLRDEVGKYLSGAELLDKLFPRLSKDDEKYKLYHEMFGKNIIYFKNTDSPQEKTERIKKSFTCQPLLELEDDAVTAVNNINVIEVNESDYKFSDENNQPTDILHIGRCAFSNCRQLETITLPQTVEDIGKFAFYNCKKLKDFKFSEDSLLQFIGDHTFHGCSSLTSMTIPNGVISIGEYAFYGCSSLTGITIPNSVINIGEYAFYGCSSLTGITIPNSVASIGVGAFYGCSSLTSITIPNSVMSIGEYAFYGCSSLTGITIPNSVASIGVGAFYGCSSLTGITIPNSVASIGVGAFYGCSSLTSITIPNSVASIGESAFSGCKSLTGITIPNGITSIGEYAFYGCSSLTSITIPNSIMSIGKRAFLCCGSLTSIIFDGSTEEWCKFSKGDLGIKHEVPVTCTDGTCLINKKQSQESDAGDGNGGEIDPQYVKALAIVVKLSSASISLIQRKCSVGYNHAGKIIEWMEFMGYISPPFGGKVRVRTVLLTTEEFESKYGSLD